MHNINELVARLEEIREGKYLMSSREETGSKAHRLLSPNNTGCDGYLVIYITKDLYYCFSRCRFDLTYGHAVVVAGLLNDKLIGPAIDYLNDVLYGVPV